MGKLQAVEHSVNQQILVHQDSESRAFGDVEEPQLKPINFVEIKPNPSFLPNSNVQSNSIDSQDGIFDSKIIKLESDFHPDLFESPIQYDNSHINSGIHFDKNIMPSPLLPNMEMLLLPENLIKFKHLIKACRMAPKILYMPQISFLKEYLESLDAKIPSNISLETNAPYTINGKENLVKYTSVQEIQSSDLISNLNAEENDLNIELQNYGQNITKEIPNERPLICQHCKMMFKNMGRLRHHIRQKHSNENSYPCNQCGKIFKTQLHLKTHSTIVHSKERRVQCDQSTTVTQRSESPEFLSNLNTKQNNTEMELDNVNQNITREIQNERPQKKTLLKQQRTNFCIHCNMTFRSIEGLWNHNMTTHGRKTIYMTMDGSFVVDSYDFTESNIEKDQNSVIAEGKFPTVAYQNNLWEDDERQRGIKPIHNTILKSIGVNTVNKVIMKSTGVNTVNNLQTHIYMQNEGTSSIDCGSSTLVSSPTCHKRRNNENKSFQNEASYDNLLINRPGNSKRKNLENETFKCNDCGKIFDFKSSLNIHMKKHIKNI